MDQFIGQCIGIFCTFYQLEEKPALICLRIKKNWKIQTFLTLIYPKNVVYYCPLLVLDFTRYCSRAMDIEGASGVGATMLG